MNERHGICKECLLPFTWVAYPSGLQRVFCGRECRYEHHSKTHKAPWLSDINNTPGRNEKLAQASRHKISATHKARGRNNGRTYAKLNGTHEHRQVAEEKLGRALLPGEIVHHKDEDKRNNDPDNLEVLPSQAEHARLHALKKNAWRKHER